MITVLYYSSNKVAEDIQRVVLNNIRGMKNPVVSVTQKPVDLGKNICIGEVGSSWLNLYKQLKIAAEAAETEYVAMAEDDCLYTQEHYDWIPPRNDTFYYNENVWFVQWGGNHPELNGMYSNYWTDRKALSQLVCSRDILLKDIELKLKFLEGDIPIETIGEPGISRLMQARALANKKGHGHSLGMTLGEMAERLDATKAETFRTTLPNLDIKGGWNFTGPKRGKNRTYFLEPWGDFKEFMA